MQAMVCRAIGVPAARARPACSPASPAAWATIVASIATVRPESFGGTPGPRALPSSVPSAATSATSVLLFPPSMASTAGRRPLTARPPTRPRAG